MVRSSFAILVLAATLIFFLPRVVFSQGETTSAIVGQVSDATGAAVPNALVTATNKETGLHRRAVSTFLN
jgi:spermidine/putrescine-binding protein